MTTVTLEEYLQKHGFPPINRAEYEQHLITTIGDIEVTASEHFAQVNILESDGSKTCVLTIPREDHGLREFAEVLLGLAK